ncbi:serine/threonine protein kinase [Streptomyces sp. WAC 06738]|uniref:bifunctional serine/threonine-protein kinase/ABC transporter substrate-binding protein n=1 Tax=Streptomyces sp. WAC 06738 TaxID=2203210 RepID=UPI000F6D596C|nr:bifunctional serine/threonine-protein kinase/ABC transporter substrate-binding protein [Streptomyces sp. WAC 06738]AZM48669.1 serine/threonine protein kinase [Streptomyces sp. WAC 06738]
MTEQLTPSDPVRIGGHRLLARLGAGGMGVVYLGRAETGELAAVKVIRPEYAAETDFRARFRREAAAARRVRSPWVVPVTGADPEAEAPWLATAFVPGPALAEAVARCGPLPERGTRILGKILARALAAVHAAGLVHRDVKPGNVLLAVDGPRLIDFGIARSPEETALTSPDAVVGTPGFLAPEQAQGREVGPAADVFALGCVLAYAATGRPPFGTGAVDALLYRTVHDDPDLAEVPDGVRDVVLRCLAKDPAARPTAAELDEALVEDAPEGTAEWLPDEVVRLIADRSAATLALPDIDATAATAPEPGRAAGRRRFLALGAGGAVLLAAGGGAALWAGLRDDGSPGPAARRWILGVQADLSGPQQAAGRAQERGVRLAVEQFNARERRPFEVEAVVADDRGDPAEAERAARRLAADRDVLAVVGSTGDKTTGAALGPYDERRVPQLTVSSAQGVYGTASRRSLLQTVPTYGTTSLPAALMLKAAGVRRLGMVIDRAAGEFAWEEGHLAYRTVGLVEIEVHPRVVPRSAASPVAVLADLLDWEPDAVYYAGGPRRGADLARGLADRGFTGVRILGYPAAGPEFTARAGAAADGWEVYAPYIDPGAKPVAKFAAAFRERYGRAPGRWAAEAYDVTRMVLDRLTEAAGGGGRPARAELFELLAKGTYRGLVREYAFQDGYLQGVEMFHYRAADGRFGYAGPADTGE